MLFLFVGICGNATNEFCSSIAIIHDETSNRLFISDFANHRIVSYASGASSGIVVAGNNGPGVNLSQLYYPVGIYFDHPSNTLLIANYDGNNVRRWTLGATTGTLFIGSLNGTAGISSSELNHPRDVSLDPMGNVYIVDAANNRIQFFPVDKTNAITIVGSSTGIGGNESTLLKHPASVILDNQLNIYVSDAENHRVQKYLRF